MKTFTLRMGYLYMRYLTFQIGRKELLLIALFVSYCFVSLPCFAETGGKRAQRGQKRSSEDLPACGTCQSEYHKLCDDECLGRNDPEKHPQCLLACKKAQCQEECKCSNCRQDRSKSCAESCETPGGGLKSPTCISDCLEKACIEPCGPPVPVEQRPSAQW